MVDIAFASEAGGKSFESVTLPFIEGLGERLRAWVDHHDSRNHERYRHDVRFVLSTKAEHGACPEMVTEDLVMRVGTIDTIVCHTDFDGLASGAKWIRGGKEPYEGCDADARAIDTRMGTPGPVAKRIDQAIRARPRDHALFGLIVRHLANGLADKSLWQPIDEAASQLEGALAEARRLALGYRLVEPGIAIVDATHHEGPYDKTQLLLIGQERAAISVVIDQESVTFAARFDSGINFLERFGISGGMPTVISIERSKLDSSLASLGVSARDVAELITYLGY